MSRERHGVAWAARRVALLTLLATATASAGTTRLVPEEFATIQDAILAAQIGDTVSVAPGTYVERIDFLGKDIVVASREGPALTTIDGATGVEKGSTVTFVGGESRRAVLRGFSIIGGTGSSVLGFDVGGGIVCVDSSPTVIGNCIRDNSYQTYNGGGVYCLRSGMHLEGNALVDNGVYKNGAAIHCEESWMTIVGNLVESNTSLTGSGVITLLNSSSVVVVGNTVRDNFNSGITCVASNSVLIRDNIVADNFSPSAGGIWVSDCDPVIEHNLIENNISDSTHGGGGISCRDSAAVISGNTIRDNQTTVAFSVGGAGIRLESFTGRVVGNLITGHASQYGSAAVSCAYQSVACFANNTFVGNTALEGIACIGADATCTIEVSNAIFWGNTSPSIGPGLVVHHSLVEGGHSGDGNLDADPRFVDLAGGDLHLRFDSPCRDAGSTDTCLAPDDFEGDPRIADGAPDMGADEFHRHLYLVGDPQPSQSVSVRLVDHPTFLPAWMFASTGLLEPPLELPVFGSWHLAAPWRGPFLLGPVPPSGVAELDADLTAVPFVLHLQAFSGQKLGNPLTIDTRPWQICAP